MENIIIVGAGPAGISAALYAARGNMDPLIINTGIGSLEKAEKIENYYGLEKPLSGKDLFERGLDQAQSAWRSHPGCPRLWEWVVLILLK